MNDIPQFLRFASNGGNHPANVGTLERWGAAVTGGVLLSFGLRNLRAKPSAGVAMLLIAGHQIYRGITGFDRVYDLLGVDTSDWGQFGTGATVQSKPIEVEKVVTINAALEDVYSFWRDFEHLPRFMDHLEAVRTLDERRSHWVAKAPLGQTVEWDAEITEDQPNELIAWRSTANADIPNEGRVEFRTATGDRGVEVRVKLQYRPPAGQAGALVAKLFGEEPGLQVAGDLRRLKQVLEAGEVPTTEGQPQGS